MGTVFLLTDAQVGLCGVRDIRAAMQNTLTVTFGNVFKIILCFSEYVKVRALL